MVRLEQHPHDIQRKSNFGQGKRKVYHIIEWVGCNFNEIRIQLEIS